MTEDPRISEIRAVLDDVDGSGACEGDGAYLFDRLAAIRAILNRPWTPSVGEKVTGIETQTIGQPTVTGWFHSSGVDGLSWLKIHEHDPETAQRYLVGTETLRPCPAPAPRVFFPDETVPAGVAVLSQFTLVRPQERGWQPISPCVEVHFPSSAEWQIAVDRARTDREVQS